MQTTPSIGSSQVTDKQQAQNRKMNPKYGTHEDRYLEMGNVLVHHWFSFLNLMTINMDLYYVKIIAPADDGPYLTKSIIAKFSCLLVITGFVAELWNDGRRTSEHASV